MYKVDGSVNFTWQIEDCEFLEFDNISHLVEEYLEIYHPEEWPEVLVCVPYKHRLMKADTVYDQLSYSIEQFFYDELGVEEFHLHSEFSMSKDRRIEIALRELSEVIREFVNHNISEPMSRQYHVEINVSEWVQRNRPDWFLEQIYGMAK